jgi:MFS family permease
VRTAALLGMCAGVIAFGAGQFLPLYFQDSLFVSPTESGLRMLPMMAGVTLTTFGVGRLIAHTGGYKRWPVIGTWLGVVGMTVIAQIDGDTSYLWLVVPMAFMGMAMGSVFTSTSIATQNAVEFRDLGVATATVMFFRSLGGSFGLAVFGTVLNSTVRSEIPRRTGVPADEAAGLIRSPEQIRALPDDTRQAVIDTIALGVSRIYWICATVMVVGAVFALILPERPLRTRAGCPTRWRAPPPERSVSSRPSPTAESTSNTSRPANSAVAVLRVAVAQRLRRAPSGARCRRPRRRLARGRLEPTRAGASRGGPSGRPATWHAGRLPCWRCGASPSSAWP